MPRRAKVSRRVITPDPKYRSRTVAKFVNNLMHDGKKTVAHTVFYDALDLMRAARARQPARYLRAGAAQCHSCARSESPARRRLDLSSPDRNSGRSTSRAGDALAHYIRPQARGQIHGREVGRRTARRIARTSAQRSRKRRTRTAWQKRTGPSRITGSSSSNKD